MFGSCVLKLGVWHIIPKKCIESSKGWFHDVLHKAVEVEQSSQSFPLRDVDSPEATLHCLWQTIEASAEPSHSEADTENVVRVSFSTSVYCLFTWILAFVLCSSCLWRIHLNSVYFCSVQAFCSFSDRRLCYPFYQSLLFFDGFTTKRT